MTALTHSRSKVLVLERDTDVRSFIADALRDINDCEVLEAADVATGRAILRDHTHIKLLLCDATLLDDPAQVAKEIGQRHRPPKILFTAGFDHPVVVQDGRIRSGIELLLKPFDTKTLTARVRDILAA